MNRYTIYIVCLISVPDKYICTETGYTSTSMQYTVTSAPAVTGSVLFAKIGTAEDQANSIVSFGANYAYFR